jgi:membrane-bound serine protease (ClpP class)
MGGILLWMVSYLLRLRRRGAVSGRESILSGVGVAVESFQGDGHIWLESESWAAHSEKPIEKGQQVSIKNMDGLVLDVEPLEPAESAGTNGEDSNTN